jgi:UDP-N-acetylmuramoyl-tripeptide--D-alanyl-D-alanine ligase
VDAIAEAKAEILEGLSPEGVAVLNGDDPRVKAMVDRVPGKVLLYGRDRAYAVSAESWRGTIHGMRFVMRLHGVPYDVALPLPGPHLASNYLAAAAVASELGVPPEVIVERALHFKAAAHRGELRWLADGVKLLDDSYNASPLALEAAVRTLVLSPSPKVAFLGDMLELGREGPALHRAAGEKIGGLMDLLVGVGSLAEELVRGAREAGASKTLTFPTSAQAAEAAPALVRPGDSVLVKGSRGMHMETVVEALLSRFPEDAGADADVL